MAAVGSAWTSVSVVPVASATIKAAASMCASPSEGNVDEEAGSTMWWAAMKAAKMASASADEDEDEDEDEDDDDDKEEEEEEEEDEEVDVKYRVDGSAFAHVDAT